MTPAESLALMVDPGLFLERQGMTPDPWQRDLLLSQDRETLLMCSRGAGKSRATSAMALHTALFKPYSLTLLIAPSERQSLELFRYVMAAYRAVGRPVAAVKENETTLELANGSRVIGLPGKEGSIRSFQGVNLMVLDEAARIPDDLYASVRPMLTVAKGRLVALTTPFGQRGWFWRAWKYETNWRKFLIDWTNCPRITAEEIENERAKLGESWVRQEYECGFSALTGLVYPEFKRCVWDVIPPFIPLGAKLVGGIDFGWRNPFAAVWGYYEPATDVLTLTGERYVRECAPRQHAEALLKVGKCRWFCDPAAPSERAELRAAGLDAVTGNNPIAPGIAAVTARLQTGRLRVSRTACPNLISEAELYRYEKEGEKPVDQDNHALAALRYLVSKIDSRFMARTRRKPNEPNQSSTPETSLARDGASRPLDEYHWKTI